MLRTHQPDYRRSGEPELLDALAGRDPLALAEAYHRTVPAAYACARRLLGSPAECEALLHTVYEELWRQPAIDGPLEGWVRARSFGLASEHLREVGRAPAAPSAAELLTDLPDVDARSHDPVEQLLATMDPDARRTLLAAHDQGISTAHAQDPPSARAALEQGLLELAGPAAGGGAEVDPECGGLPLGDWILGLLDAATAARVETQATANESCAARARLLRRGRRRLEGLPPTPDMGQRVLARVLTGSPGPAEAPPEPVREDPASREEPEAAPDDELSSALDAPPDDEPEEPALWPVEDDEPAPAPSPVPLPVADEPGAVAVAADEEWPWEGRDDGEAAEEEEPVRRSTVRRVLGVVGILLLVAVGAVVGLLVGSMLIGQ